MNSHVNQINRFFNGFLSDSAEITSCVYSKTIGLLNRYGGHIEFISGALAREARQHSTMGKKIK